MNKKELKKQNYISMEKFIRQYLNIENEHVIEMLLDLNHYDFRMLCKELGIIDLTCIPYKNIALDDLETGRILLVADGKSNGQVNLAPYVNPLYSKIDTIMDEIEDQARKEAFDIDQSFESYDDYVDVLDDIAFDQKIPNRTMKKLSYRRIVRRGE